MSAVFCICCHLRPIKTEKADRDHNHPPQGAHARGTLSGAVAPSAGARCLQCAAGGCETRVRPACCRGLQNGPPCDPKPCLRSKGSNLTTLSTDPKALQTSAHNLGTSSPKLAEAIPNLVETGTELVEASPTSLTQDRVRSRSAERWAKLAEISPDLADSGQICRSKAPKWPNKAQISSTPIKLGRTWPTIGRNRQIAAQDRPDFVELIHNLVEFSPNWSNKARIWPKSANVGREFGVGAHEASGE